MKYLQLTLICIMLFATAVSQDKQYVYYFDKDLNMVDSPKAVFYGTGQTDGDRLSLMLYNINDKHLIVIQHFMDSSLQVSDGLFTSFFTNTKKESEGKYAAGKQDGWWRQWDTTGNIIDSSLYETGQLNLKKRFTHFTKVTEVFISDLKRRTSSYEYYDKEGHLIRPDTTHNNDDDKDKVFLVEEIQPAFPGGDATLKYYLNKKIKAQLDESDYNSRCVIRFIVRISGEVTDVQAVSGNSALAAIVVAAIKKGPKWMPGQQNGRYINAYKTITVIYP